MPILRLAFAMGGSVSLGTFSGAALSEVIKLFLVQKEGSKLKYDRVVIDAFSGASGGALSLLLMLGTLANPQAEHFVKVAEARSTLINWLRKHKLPSDEGDWPSERWADLLAAQMVQQAQYRAWVKDIDINKLLPGKLDNLRYEASILSRGAVESIAKCGLALGDATQRDLRPRLLAERVLFACSLTSLIPTIFDATENSGAYPSSLAGLADGMRSFSHRDLRVFDLSFGQHAPKEAVNQWVRYHNAAKDSGNTGDLRLREAWARMAATAIACGAFPFAFEPVVLERSKYEFRSVIWDEFGDALKDEQKSHAILPYVDGGVLNNEPIREAYRLCGFQDATNDDTAPYVRKVVFVDPSVSMDKPVTHLEYARQYAVSESLLKVGGVSVKRLPTALRLFSFAPTLITAIRNEASTVEADKVFSVHDVFDDRDELREVLAPMVKETLPQDALIELCSYLERKIAERAESTLLPSGGLTLVSELRRVRREQGKIVTETEVEQFLDAIAGGGPLEGEWVRALLYLALDQMLDLEGKSEKNQLIAIGPFRKFPKKDPAGMAPTSPAGTGAPKKPERVPLFGSGTSAFDGFMSEAARDRDFRVGRLCAEAAMTTCALHSGTASEPWPSDSVPDEIADEIRGGRKRLALRAAKLIEDVIPSGAGVIPLSVITSMLLHGKLESLLSGQPIAEVKGPFEVPFCVYTSLKSLELDEANTALSGDEPAIGLEDDPAGKHALFAKLTYDPFASGTSPWSGRNLDPSCRYLIIDEDGSVFEKDRPFFDKTYCWIPLPEEAEVNAWQLYPVAVLATTIPEKPVIRESILTGVKWEPKSLLPESLRKRLVR